MAGTDGLRESGRSGVDLRSVLLQLQSSLMQAGCSCQGFFTIMAMSLINVGFRAGYLAWADGWSDSGIPMSRQEKPEKLITYSHRPHKR